MSSLFKRCVIRRGSSKICCNDLCRQMDGLVRTLFEFSDTREILLPPEAEPISRSFFNCFQLNLVPFLLNKLIKIGFRFRDSRISLQAAGKMDAPFKAKQMHLLLLLNGVLLITSQKKAPQNVIRFMKLQSSYYGLFLWSYRTSGRGCYVYFL